MKPLHVATCNIPIRPHAYNTKRVSTLMNSFHSNLPRLSRMDAAVDALAPFGFPADKVKQGVKELLKVYGGDDGWPFIEEYSYKELIEALLRDVNEEDNNAVDTKEKNSEDQSEDVTSSSIAQTEQHEKTEESIPGGHLPRRLQPCYGWIESDEEEDDDFVFLKPSSCTRRISRWDLKPDDP
ncbi:Nucleolar histone methyltransferase-related protein [Striga hermonthica]|uniref:Nucleolar histone methyltransferase-related protein n=1 Tax=Striga hermonthica TaxID=68872 RepID=A0A9N7NNS2_STRHE|nr:Nucleolar histone methyltransferase-related protein [Striga hermonthica]